MYVQQGNHKSTPGSFAASASREGSWSPRVWKVLPASVGGLLHMPLALVTFSFAPQSSTLNLYIFQTLVVPATTRYHTVVSVAETPPGNLAARTSREGSWSARVWKVLPASVGGLLHMPLALVTVKARRSALGTAARSNMPRTQSQQ
jgi:hypothetical protein